MDELISRQAAIDAMTENKERINAVLDFLTLDYNTRRNQEQRREQINEDIETIKALPSAQPERKRGKWIKQNPFVDTEECSLCKFNIYSEELETPFCPWCGAEMQKGEEDETD